MSVNSILRVSSEGGPLIVCDSAALCKWRGAFGSDHFERACESVDAERPVGEIIVGGDVVLSWEIGGVGSADVIEIEGSLFVVRYWADDFLDRETLVHAMAESEGQRKVTDTILDLPSGIVVVLWAAEDGSKLAIGPPPCGTPDGELSIGDGAIYVQVDAGKLLVCHREVVVRGIEYLALELVSQR